MFQTTKKSKRICLDFGLLKFYLFGKRFNKVCGTGKILIPDGNEFRIKLSSAELAP
jgi:hypothetical protein